MKHPQKKGKRVVLGEGYPAGWREDPITIKLVNSPSPLHNLACPLSRWKKIRLVAEILEDNHVK